MPSKTISNTFVVNAIVDGESTFDVTLDNQIAGVECDKSGNIVGDINIPFRISAHYGSNDVIDACTITDNHEDVDSDIDVSYSQQQIGLVTLSLHDGNALGDTNVIAFTVVHPQYGTRVVSFTVKRIINGESAPFYNEEWYAWSDVASTANTTTSPFTEPYSGWQKYIPEQGSLAYLWKKIIRYNYNASTKQYVASTAQYFRMSGTNGTSIKTKGSVDYENSSQGSGTALNLIQNPADGDAYVVGLDLSGHQGWLYQWTVEGDSWLPLGQFKGESGKTYYTHIAWATNVDTSTTPITVQGFVTFKLPNDTTHLWMGVLVDENSGQDSSNAALYSWSYTKGIDGQDAVTYEVQVSRDNITIQSGETSATTTMHFRFYSKQGNSTKTAFSTYWSLYKRSSDDIMELVLSIANKTTQLINYSLTATTSELGYVMYIWGDSRFTDSNPESHPYLAKAEVVVLKNGDNGQNGERGKVGRFYYFAETFNAQDATTLFVVNDAQVPYFEHLVDGQKRYHVFNPETTPEGGSLTMAEMWAASNESWNNAPWEVMTNDFKYLITEALFGKYANLGSFLINEDWLMSNLGSIAGNTNSQISYKEWKNNNWVDVQAPAYTFFDATELKEDKTGVWAITEPWMEGDKETFNLLDGLYYFECTVENCLITLADEYGYSYILVDTTSGGQVASSFFFKLPHSGNYTLDMYEYSVGDGAKVVVAGGFYKAQFVPYIAINGSNGQIYHSGDNGSFYAKWLDMVKGNIGMFRVLNDWNESSIVSSKDVTTNPDNFTQLTEDGQLVLIHKNNHSSTQMVTNEALHVEGNIYFGSLANMKIGNYSLYVDSNGFLKAQQS